MSRKIMSKKLISKNIFFDIIILLDYLYLCIIEILFPQFFEEDLFLFQSDLKLNTA